MSVLIQKIIEPIKVGSRFIFAYIIVSIPLDISGFVSTSFGDISILSNRESSPLIRLEVKFKNGVIIIK